MSRSAVTAALPCLLLAAVGANASAPLEEVVVTAPEPRYVAPTTRDRSAASGRPC